MKAFTLALIFVIFSTKLKCNHSQKNTFLQAVAFCSPKILYQNPATLLEFQVKTENFNLISTLPLKINFLENMQPPNKTSKLVSLHLIKQHQWQCECVIVLLAEAGNPFLETPNFKDIVYNIQNPRRDYFFFVTADSTVTEESIYRNWFSDLRFYVFSQLEKLLLDNVELNKNEIFQEFTSRTLRTFLSGKFLKVTTLLLDPFITIDDGLPTGGCFYNLVLYASQNFNYTFHMDVPSWAGASQLPNGTWLGPIGDVINGKKDLILGTAQTFERDPFLDFPNFYELSGIKFATAFPKTKVNWGAVMYIFQPKTWICLCLACGSIFMATFIGTWIWSENFQSKDIFMILAITFNPLIEHSATVPKINIIRYIYSINILTSLVIITYFKSDFIAYVTYPSSEKIPRTYAELGDRLDYQIQLMNLNAAESVFFNKTTNPVYVRVRERMLFESDWAKCMFSAAFEERTVCVHLEFMGLGITAQNLTLSRLYSPIVYSPDKAYHFHWSMGFTRHSKYVDSFSRIIEYLRDTGNIRKWMEDVYEYRRVSGIKWLSGVKGRYFQKILNSLTPQMSMNVSPFELRNVLLSLFIGTIGLCISGAVFLGENVLGHWRAIHLMFIEWRFKLRWKFPSIFGNQW
ncbi:unnamed protein product [Allacma fusca]|uniref:Ionotropic receptor n=1 Tax=Allacma fusca TaxID=39272 RepID=A0A8J2PZU9_9HEXA|nr:unnamed protein product [Allacma fusca]